MGVQNPNSTSYVHPDEPNLLNLHKAMAYDDSGAPHVRVSLGSDTITIAGNLNIADSFRINNTEAQRIPVYLVGNVLTVNQGTSPWVTTGNINLIGNISGITTMPAVTGNVVVSGNVSITQLPALGNVSITQLPAVSGNVSITQLPALGNVSITQMPAVSGNVSITQLPALGNVSITQLPALGNVSITQLPALGNVSITQLPALGNVSITQMPALGNVSITQLPAVSGNVSITQLPALGNVSITQMPAVSGTVGVSGNIAGITTMPAVRGNVSITQMPAVSGNVSITQLPTINGNVGVSGNIGILNAGSIVTALNPLPVTLGSANITVVGNTNIVDTVTVASTEADPVHVHISEVGTSGILAVPYLPVGGNVSITQLPALGNVSITRMPALGNVSITQLPALGNVSITQMPAVSGNVSITQLPALGNVSITQMPAVAISSLPEVEIKNDTGNPIPISANTSVNSNTNPIYVKGTSDTSFFSPMQSDAFGRLRVSEPFTLFDTQARYYDHRQFANSTSGTASVTYVASESSFRLAIGTASGDSVIQETVRVFPYQPGKSQLTLNTFCFATPKTNLRQRVGLFSATDGVFFENDGTYNYFVIRSGSTGVEERVRQDAWNIDRMNPSYTLNPSGVTLYPDRTQIMFADVEWLGVGSVRVGFVINGAYVACHQFNHANQSGNTKVYMTTATLPIRYEITNTGITASTSTMTQICSSVISEGGFQLEGNPRSIGHDLSTPITLPNDVSFKPLMSIRLKSTMLDSVVLPTNFTVAPAQAANFKFRLYAKAVTSGGTWTSAGASSPIEYNLAPTSVSSGDIVDEGFIIASNQTSAVSNNVPLSFIYQLERNSFSGVAYEFVISAATTGTNQSMYASVQWQEVV